ncbi:MAG: hypothetical protein AN485_05430 [Anabaena sp. MDT14b]|nr:MAG: hypothetical protein AN485_05430 [Anabaena sp. MDT14b]
MFVPSNGNSHHQLLLVYPNHLLISDVPKAILIFHLLLIQPTSDRTLSIQPTNDRTLSIHLQAIPRSRFAIAPYQSNLRAIADYASPTGELALMNNQTK